MTYTDNPEVFKKYNSKKWDKVRKMKLSYNPFCERCLEKGYYVPAYLVHHKEYITDLNYTNPDVMFNLDNLESLCMECHNKEHFEGKSKKEYVFDKDGNVIKNKNYQKKEIIYEV